MKPALNDYYKDIQLCAQSKEDVFLNHIQFTDMMIEASLIIDFQRRNFYNVGNHDFFLCGYPLEEVKEMGYRFFDKVIHPDDILLWAEMHNAILKSLYEQEFTMDECIIFHVLFVLRIVYSSENRLNI